MADRDTIRAFLAVDMSAELKSSIIPFLEDARRLLPQAKVVSAHNLHVTLHFFASLDRRGVEAVGAIASEVAQSFEDFTLELGQIGAFPNERRPRVLWIGIERGAKELEALAARLARRLLDAGIDVDPRPYRPHLTFARLRKPVSVPGKLKKEWARLRLPAQRAAELVLFRSILRPDGPIYEPVFKFPLRRE